MISAYPYTAYVFDCKKLLFRKFLTKKKETLPYQECVRRTFNSLLEVNKYLANSDFCVIHKTGIGRIT